LIEVPDATEPAFEKLKEKVTWDGAHLQYFLWLVEHYGMAVDDTDWSNLAAGAARLGELETIRYLIENGYGSAVGARTMDIAAENGNDKVLEYVFKHKKPVVRCTSRAVIQAIRNRYVKVIQCLQHFIPILDSKDIWTAKSLHVAAEVGNLGVVQLFYENRKEDFIPQILWKAAERGHYEIVKFLYQKMSVEESDREEHLLMAFKLAAKNVHWNVVEYLMEETILDVTNLDDLYWKGLLYSTLSASLFAHIYEHLCRRKLRTVASRLARAAISSKVVKFMLCLHNVDVKLASEDLCSHGGYKSGIELQDAAGTLYSWETIFGITLDLAFKFRSTTILAFLAQTKGSTYRRLIIKRAEEEGWAQLIYIIRHEDSE
jgi:hypothetical protein